MVAYWAGFIKSGNPNQSGLPVWPQYSGKTQSYGGSSVMLLAPGSVGSYNSDNQHQCSSFWKYQYPSNL
jgi:carboxylesterase type B